MNTTRFLSISLTKFASFITALVLLFVSTTRASEGPDEKYLNIVSTIDQADSMSANGQVVLARVKYQKAQAALIEFKRDFPASDARAVAYRLNYLADKIAATTPKPQNADASAGTATSISSSEKNPANGSAAPVKLLDAGSEPRKILRLHPTAGDTQTLAMTTKTTMAMTMAGAPVPAMKLPATQMKIEITVQDVAANGNITYGLTIADASVMSDPEVMPQVADALKASMSRFHGISGTGAMSDRGGPLGTQLSVPADADPQSRQTLEQLKESFMSSSAAFPEEAVGVGARWEVKSKLKSQGMTIDQTMTYELVSNEDGHLNFKNTVTQNAASQKMENPTMPGIKVDLTKMNGTGTGTVLLDLAKIMPVESILDEHIDMAMSVNMAGQKQNMTTQVDSSVHLGPN